MPPSGQMARRTFWGMPHINENLLCAIDLRTTGSNPVEDNIVEISILPLDSMLKPHPKFLMFNIRIKPTKVDLDPRKAKMQKGDFAQAVLKGVDKYRAGDMFLEWVKSTGLRDNKQIWPLSYNWVEDSAFLKEWLGQETFEIVFNYRYRDILGIANYMNDRADVCREEVPYAKLDFNWLTSVHKIEKIDKYSSTSDVMSLSKLYKEMLLNPPIPLPM